MNHINKLSFLLLTFGFLLVTGCSMLGPTIAGPKADVEAISTQIETGMSTDALREFLNNEKDLAYGVAPEGTSFERSNEPVIDATIALAPAGDFENGIIQVNQLEGQWQCYIDIETRLSVIRDVSDVYCSHD